MSFRLSLEDLQKIMSIGGAIFFNARIAWIIWETEKAAVQDFLPPGLSMVDPYAFAYVADYPSTNFSLSYRESALFLAIQSETGKLGLYCVAMPVTDEVALFAGRQVGYPKKMAHIHYEETENTIMGYTERYNYRFMEIRLDLTRSLDVPPNTKVLEYLTPRGGTIFNIIDIHTDPLDVTGIKEYIVYQRIRSKPERAMFCAAEINFTSSKFDPWVNIPIKKNLFGMAFQGQLKMKDVHLDHQISVAQGIPVAFPRMFDTHHFIQGPEKSSNIVK